VTALVECDAGAGPDDESASPGCSDEEQSALAKLTPLSTLADPTTVIALLSGSVQHFDAGAMALTEPVGAVALSWADTGEDAECMVAIRPRNAANVTLTFTSFNLGNYGFLQVYDGSSTAAPLLATLTGNGLPLPVTSRSNAMLLQVTRDPTDVAGGFAGTYRIDNAPLESSTGALAASVAASACVAAKRAVSHMCRQCILATIAAVCGSRCVQERFHIMHDGPPPAPSHCLPSLAHRMAIEQAGRLEGVVSQLEPFGLSSEPSPLGPSLNITDLYMPAVVLGESTQPVVYVGLDSGNRIVRCNPVAFPRLMVVMTHSSSMEPDASTNCTGSAWLDLRTGQITLHPQSDTEPLPFLIHDIPSKCSVVLRSAPPVVGDTLVFASGESVGTVQCWLMRFFGPQAAPQSMHRVTLTPALSVNERFFDPLT
jgi:hypothetical protein